MPKREVITVPSTPHAIIPLVHLTASVTLGFTWPSAVAESGGVKVSFTGHCKTIYFLKLVIISIFLNELF